jgi:iron(III) transport system ATP-binding protein
VTALTLEALTKIFPRSGTVVDSIDLHINEGEFFTLLGPSGCGKSTTLRMIAGFEDPTSGRVFFDKTDVTHEPPNRRAIGFVFQNYALFPHLSVAENVAFGLEVRKFTRKEIAERVSAVLDDVRLAGLNNARVDQLSGGQQQRVALARALVIRPRLLLLDEPLSNLDAKLRQETRAALRLLHTSTRVTTIYVTHDQREALAISNRIAVLQKGRIHQAGTPEEIYEHPATRFVAEFIGRNNILEATIVSISGDSAVVRFTDGTQLTVDSRRAVQGLELSVGMRLSVCLRAESLHLSHEGTFSGIVIDVEYAGAASSCAVRTEIGVLQVEIPALAGRPVPGESVRLKAAGSAAHLVAST